MISKTIGVGGDYANYGTAISYLLTLSPLSDDVTFTQISDITGNGNTGENHNVDLNGHTLRFTSLAHGGNPNSGYIYTVTSYYGIVFSIPNTHTTGNIIIENINFVSSFNDSSKLILINDNERNVVNKQVNIRDCIFDGGDSPLTSGIATGFSSIIVNIYNCKFFDCLGGAINVNSNVLVGTKQTKTIENCTCFNCYYAPNTGTGSPIALSSPSWVVKNVVCCNNITPHDTHYRDFSQYNPSYAAYTYCSDSDGTCPDGTGNIHNVVPENEFQSVVKTSSVFLFLKNTTLTYNPKTYTYGSVNLGSSGTSPSLTSTDIAGNTYIDENSKLPIGCHAPSFSKTFSYTQVCAGIILIATSPFTAILIATAQGNEATNIGIAKLDFETFGIFVDTVPPITI